jgi:uncharacterized membrane protein
MQPEFVKRMFGRTIEQLDDAERRILHKAREHQVVSTNAEDDFQSGSAFGERLADGIARVGGSWSFILGFLLFLVVWAVINTLLLTRTAAFDPYPFIFLNLVLSMLAAIQAPIIMMSQNRQSERDRFFAAKDYEVNLKAEIEVMALHHKIDMAVLIELQSLRADVASCPAASVGIGHQARPALLILRQAVIDLVEIALVGAEDVIARRQTRRLVERAGLDRRMVRPLIFPEQRRAAMTAEAAPPFVAGNIPGDSVGTVDREIGVGGIGRGIIEPGLPAALAAMAENKLAHRPVDAIFDGAAEAAAGVQFAH